MLWFVIALQAWAPFVHAHAGAVQTGRTAWLHEPPGLGGDVAFHAIERGEQGGTADVAQGMPWQPAAPAAANAGASSPLPVVRPSAARMDAVVTVAPPLRPTLPDHVLPHALAPPFG